MSMATKMEMVKKMKRRQGFGQIIITAMFVYSAILCHFHASSMLEIGNKYEAILFWFTIGVRHYGDNDPDEH